MASHRRNVPGAFLHVLGDRMTSLSEGLTRAASLPTVEPAVEPADPAPRRPDNAVTDSELLRRCRRHDPEAWAGLVGRYERLVYTVARRAGLDAEDAADVTHATFVALVEALHHLPEDVRLASWLMTVARRQVWSIGNLNGRSAALGIVHEPVADPLADPFADWETATALQDALSTLGGMSRELLIALYFEGEAPSHATVARLFGRPVAAIGQMRGRCLEELRMIRGEEA